METVDTLGRCPETCPRLGGQRQALSNIFFLILTLVRVHKPSLVPFSLFIGQSCLLDELCARILADTELFMLMLVIALGASIRLDGVLDVAYRAVHDVADIRSGRADTGGRHRGLEDAALSVNGGAAPGRLVGERDCRHSEVVVGGPSTGRGVVARGEGSIVLGRRDGCRRCRLVAVDIVDCVFSVEVFIDSGLGLGDVCCREKTFFALCIASSPPAVAECLVFLEDDDVLAG